MIIDIDRPRDFIIAGLTTLVGTSPVYLGQDGYGWFPIRNSTFKDWRVIVSFAIDKKPCIYTMHEGIASVLRAWENSE